MSQDEPRVTVLAPEGALLTGGTAEQFEERIQALLAEGHRHLLVNLTSVPHVDSSGIRALVRGHTTSQRLGASFVVVAPTPRVAKLLSITHLDTVLDIRPA